VHLEKLVTEQHLVKVAFKSVYKRKSSQKVDRLFLNLFKFTLKKFSYMEALVYTFLLIGTLMILFFAAFFREAPKIIRSQ
jgi:hypothetical protein